MTSCLSTRSMTSYAPCITTSTPCNLLPNDTKMTDHRKKKYPPCVNKPSRENRFTDGGRKLSMKVGESGKWEAGAVVSTIRD